ncbi:SCP2 domain-containing protein [Vibrio sp. SM6]|uniref:Ubiquinone biosynthesis accessory factor UbiJ n=1 Tax=Vibrio agarilyticus TaxID=2726741 RepID=A0A7X8TRL1_9VIBR|nr:SCP2 domain-containing protein [Vibrio agarilyticus]NLS13692.1 SCP2 domain-containing protein [Vibrio agarilyticus]
MPFDPLVTAVVETTLNTLLRDDPELMRRLARLRGKVIQVHLKEWQKSLTFVFSQQVDVLAHYEGEPDCYLALSLSVLPQLRDQANITQLIKQDKLELTGDIQLAQSFSRLLHDAKPDLEEWLSRVTGDALAHTLVGSAKQFARHIRQRQQQHQSHLAQVLVEEWRIAPGPLEVAHFCDEVDALQSQTAHLQARLDRWLDTP